MMQMSSRQMRMRQKLMKRFWRFWRACWGISMVEALLMAERVRYCTFSMTPARCGWGAGVGRVSELAQDGKP